MLLSVHYCEHLVNLGIGFDQGLTHEGIIVQSFQSEVAAFCLQICKNVSMFEVKICFQTFHNELRSLSYVCN